MENGKILIVTPDKLISDTLLIFFNELNFKVMAASDGKKGIEAYRKEKPNLIIADIKLPQIDGISLLKIIKKSDQNIPIILTTTFDDTKPIIEAMQIGAYDCIENPLDLGKLKSITMDVMKLNKEKERLEIETTGFNNVIDEDIIIGKTPKMREILKIIGKVSSNKVNILIEGESGTGKELISRVIHNSGITMEYPFISVNLSSLPESFLEEELFGFEKKMTDGTIRIKKGKFELADKGTIFLDEISELTPKLQVMLLNVIQAHEFKRIDCEAPIQLKARVIMATNKNLQQLVEQGKFRADLFYLFNVFKIKVPPLREHKEDIPGLVIHFLKRINKQLHKKVNKIPYEVIEILKKYEWTGNIRELENTLLQAVVLAKSETLEKENILLRNNMVNTIRSNPIDLSLNSIEKEHIKEILNRVNWNKKEAAKLLKISRQTLYNKIKLHTIIQS